MMEFLSNFKNFFIKLFQAMGNVFFWLVTTLAFLIGYPAQKSILVCTLVLFILDFVTRFYAIGVKNKGLIKAFMSGEFSSKSFINGFLTKIVSYFTILSIAHFAKITPELTIIGGFVSSFLYVSLFFYEAISNLENLRDANFLAAIPILNKLKKEQDKFFKSDNEK